HARCSWHAWSAQNLVPDTAIRRQVLIFFKQKTAYEIGLGIPAEPLFRSSSWKALNLQKTLLMASSVRLKPLNCSRLPCVYAQETLTFLLTQKKTCVKNYVQKE